MSQNRSFLRDTFYELSEFKTFKLISDFAGGLTRLVFLSAILGLVLKTKREIIERAETSSLSNLKLLALDSAGWTLYLIALALMVSTVLVISRWCFEGVKELVPVKGFRRGLAIGFFSLTIVWVAISGLTIVIVLLDNGNAGWANFIQDLIAVRA